MPNSSRCHPVELARLIFFIITMNKPAYTIFDQIALLKQRGMTFRDEAHVFNKQKITNLIDAYPNVPIYKYGFFNNWRNEPLWN